MSVPETCFFCIAITQSIFNQIKYFFLYYAHLQHSITTQSPATDGGPAAVLPYYTLSFY